MKTLNIFILVLLLLFSPVIVKLVLFGSSGNSSDHYVIIGLGYLLGVISCIAAIYKPKFIAGTAIGIVFMGVGYVLDKNFWQTHNSELCAEL